MSDKKINTVNDVNTASAISDLSDILGNEFGAGPKKVKKEPTKFEKAIDKIKFIAFFTLFAGIFLTLIHPIFLYVTVVSSCVIYVSILIKSRIDHGKFDFLLCFLCSLALTWVMVRSFTEFTYSAALGYIIVYGFLLRAFKLSTGKWNFFIIGLGSVGIALSVLNVHLDMLVLDIGVLLLQLVIIFKFLDPILEKIGQAKRAQRLAYEAQEAKKKEEAERASKENIEANEAPEDVINDDVHEPSKIVNEETDAETNR